MALGESASSLPLRSHADPQRQEQQNANQTSSVRTCDQAPPPAAGAASAAETQRQQEQRQLDMAESTLESELIAVDQAMFAFPFRTLTETTTTTTGARTTGGSIAPAQSSSDLLSPAFGAPSQVESTQQARGGEKWWLRPPTMEEEPAVQMGQAARGADSAYDDSKPSMMTVDWELVAEMCPFLAWNVQSKQAANLRLLALQPRPVPDDASCGGAATGKQRGLQWCQRALARLGRGLAAVPRRLAKAKGRVVQCMVAPAVKD